MARSSMTRWIGATYGTVATPLTAVSGFQGYEERLTCSVVRSHSDADIGYTGLANSGYTLEGAVIVNDYTQAIALGALMAVTGLWVQYKNSAGITRTRKLVSGVVMGAPEQMQFRPSGSSGDVPLFRIPFKAVWATGQTLATAITLAGA